MNRHKIIVMTRLALYDKHGGDADRVTCGFFRHDFIYRRNMATRLAVGVCGVLLALMYWLRAFFEDGLEDFFSATLQQDIIDTALFVVALMAAYTLIGTITGTREYYLAQERLRHYNSLTRQLAKLEEKTDKLPAQPKPEERTARVPRVPREPREELRDPNALDEMPRAEAATRTLPKTADAEALVYKAERKAITPLPKPNGPKGT